MNINNANNNQLDEEELNDKEEDLVIQATALAAISASLTVTNHSQTYYDKIPYHNSALTSDKFHLTLGFACNADGSEKLPLFFIGKSKRPQCFKRLKKKTPGDEGFYYQNNKKAWMTSELFKE